MTQDLEIATLIKNHIPTMDLLSWAARNYQALPEKIFDNGTTQLGGLQFTVSNNPNMKFKAEIFIKLMGNDTYTLEIGRYSKSQWKPIRTYAGMHREMLVPLINDILG